MKRLSCTILLSSIFLILIVFIGSANAGGYRERVWSTESCCYRKIVRHTRRVHYVPVGVLSYVEPHRVVQISALPDPLLYDSAVTAFAYAGAICYRRLMPLKNGRGGWHWAIEMFCY